jgi:hypothetical protein
VFPLNIVCKSLTPLALSRQSTSSRICAKKKIPRVCKAASHHSDMPETSMKCGFYACVCLVDGATRARAKHASSAVFKAE